MPVVGDFSFHILKIYTDVISSKDWKEENLIVNNFGCWSWTEQNFNLNNQAFSYHS